MHTTPSIYCIGIDFIAVSPPRRERLPNGSETDPYSRYSSAYFYRLCFSPLRKPEAYARRAPSPPRSLASSYPRVGTSTPAQAIAPSTSAPTLLDEQNNPQSLAAAISSLDLPSDATPPPPCSSPTGGSRDWYPASPTAREPIRDISQYNASDRPPNFLFFPMHTPPTASVSPAPSPSPAKRASIHRLFLVPALSELAEPPKPPSQCAAIPRREFPTKPLPPVPKVVCLASLRSFFSESAAHSRVRIIYFPNYS